MPFLQLSLEFALRDPDVFEAACFDAGALSVTLTDAADSPIFEPALGMTPLWPTVHISALFDAHADRQRIVAMLVDVLGRPPPDHQFEEIADRAWEREWLVDFKPMRFGNRLWVCPHELHLDQPDATVVRLDPGLAFGTGTHQTTALCLEWLDGADLHRRTVIDFGCGSGILAIAAAKLGAARVFAVDHDPQALLAARENAERNDVSEKIEVLAPGAALPVADLLLANILALPLIELAPAFRPLLRPQGDLVLCGILSEQAAEVAAAYSPWAEMAPAVQRDDWVRLHGRKR